MNQKGQTLIEVLVGLATLVIVISAITSAVLTSLYNAQFSKNQNLATAYAQQGIETIRNMRNADIASISATYLQSTSYCLGSMCTGLVSEAPSVTNPNIYCWTKTSLNCPQNVDIFSREIDINQQSVICQSGSTGDVEVTAKVGWSDSKCSQGQNLFCHKVSITTCLSDFTIAPTP